VKSKGKNVRVRVKVKRKERRGVGTICMQWSGGVVPGVGGLGSTPSQAFFLSRARDGELRIADEHLKDGVVVNLGCTVHTNMDSGTCGACGACGSVEPVLVSESRDS
jgi:hypothetical protein